MGITYEITSFDFDTDKIHFKIYNGESIVSSSIGFEDKSDMDGYMVASSHYRDSNGEIWKIKNIHTKIIKVDNGETYIKARQWELDKWMKIKSPDCINAIIYDKITKNGFISSTV